jgi:hypothetical protein
LHGGAVAIGAAAYLALAVLLQATPKEGAPAQQRASMEEIMRVAKRDLGKIDRELREQEKAAGVDKADKEIGGGAFSAAGSADQQRLAKGIEAAHAAAPNKWYQAAKIEDFTPPGDDARKIYKVTTALGTYCVRYKDKNRAWDHGQANLGEPLSGACPHMMGR